MEARQGTPWFQLHFSAAVLGLLAAYVHAETSLETPTYRLWDQHERIDQYAVRAGIPAIQTLDLGNNVTMDMVLIPAGKFWMGAEAELDSRIPREPKECSLVGAVIFLIFLCLPAMLVILAIWNAVRKRRRPSFSLRWFLIFVMFLSMSLYGAVRYKKISAEWQRYAQELDQHRIKYNRWNLSRDDEKPAHIVTITKPFYMGKFDVTQEQYQQVTGTNPSPVKDRARPVQNVSWNDAKAFAERLSRLTNLTIDLPTEAEWEFAARAGTTTNYYSGDDEAALNSIAWYSHNATGSQPVGKKVPNAFGLYDMCGNVWQWCSDFYNDNTYSSADSTCDPLGPPNGERRVLRGSYWGCPPRLCRSASRMYMAPWVSADQVGFRVILSCKN